MANKQIIFVVETNEKKKTDDIYINKFIRSYYDLSNNDITIKFVHMCGKTNYKNKTVVTKINKLINQNSKGENIVIYCFDTDRIDKEIDDLKFLKEVEEYCKNNLYDLIWFCYEIENVFLGKTISDENKVVEAVKYQRKEVSYDDKLIKNLSIDKNEKKTNNKSNIVLVLNKHLKKKVG